MTVGSCVDGFERGPANFAEQPTGEKVTLACHSSCHVWVQVIGVQTCEDVLAHSVHTLGAWCEHNVLLFYADVDTLYLVCLGWWLSLRWFHPISQCAVENPRKLGNPMMNVW